MPLNDISVEIANLANEDENHIKLLEVENFLKINKHKKHVLR
jgi:hypothetical protein